MKPFQNLTSYPVFPDIVSCEEMGCPWLMTCEQGRVVCPLSEDRCYFRPPRCVVDCKSVLITAEKKRLTLKKPQFQGSLPGFSCCSLRGSNWKRVSLRVQAKVPAAKDPLIQVCPTG